MRRRLAMRLAVVILASAAPTVAAQEKAPQLPAALVAEWKDKAGARDGWMDAEEYGFLPFRDSLQREGKKGPLPAFQILLWRSLAGLPQPKEPFGLALHNSTVKDAALKEVAAFKNLQALSLGGAEITDAGLKELAPLKRLQWLSVSYTPITNTGLKELAGLKRLQVLNLGLTQITDAGLKELVELKDLQKLHLGFTRITDAGLKELAPLKGLQELSLSTTAQGEMIFYGKGDFATRGVSFAWSALLGGRSWTSSNCWR